MNEAERGLLSDLRHALLHLHKTLLDWERGSYERIHGKKSGTELLDTILHDHHFAWLRPISELIVRIDETLEEPPDLPVDLNVILSQARVLAGPDEIGDAYARRYHTALQEHPDAVLAHRDLAALLRKAAP